VNLVDAVLALEPELPPMRALYEYVIGAGGLYIRAEDRHLAALVPVALRAAPAPRPLTGLALVEPYAKLRAPRVPAEWLRSILHSARAAMPREAMYQLVVDDAARHSVGGWACARPKQVATPGMVRFLETEAAAVDLHSHHSMRAFFSSTDDADETGLKFYCVIGCLDTERPEIAARVGVYGHTMRIPARTIFESLAPFVDNFGRCRVCGCSERHACEGGCFWVEEDLCSNCAEREGESDASLR
jgi:PRTRC genetic system protein A